MRARRQMRRNGPLEEVKLPEDVLILFDEAIASGFVTDRTVGDLYQAIVDYPTAGTQAENALRWMEDRAYVTSGDAGWTGADVGWRLVERLREIAGRVTYAALYDLIVEYGRHGRHRNGVEFTHGRPDPEMLREDVARLYAAERTASPRAADKVLERFTLWLDGYGVEPLSDERAYVSSYYMDIIALYVNEGDTYSQTLLYDTEFHTFYLTSWGDFMESWEQNAEDEPVDDDEDEPVDDDEDEPVDDDDHEEDT